MFGGRAFRAAVACATGGMASTTISLCHGNHNHYIDSDAERTEQLERMKHTDSVRLADLERKVEMLANKLAAQREGVQEYSGQGGMVFSWDQDLTACFPEDAKPYERDMHGCFAEDPDTGEVYTGIAGYGLCRISKDLTTWEKVGDDERLEHGNVHGLCVFTHSGESHLAIADNVGSRILIVSMEGVVQQEMLMPKGGEFTFGEAKPPK